MTEANQPDVTGPFVSPPLPPGAPLTLGMVLGGRYRLVGLLGRGGMGEVYRADDLTLGQAVALKFLPFHLSDPERLARFRKEVAAARRVSHPNVCRVHDLAEVEGRTFLSMEFIDGEDLSSLLKRVGRLPEEKGIEVARQLCSALAAVHEQNLLHRDLKPANVMLDGRGKVRLTDFGLAAAEVEARDVASGTPAYMAPEQLTGREVTVRSDLFALGLVLYEVFTGRRAFPASDRAELLRLHADSTPSKPSSHVSGLDANLERVILRCLERDPGNRPRSAFEVLAALPGGDPLAAALAAGETPSPKMVAEAGGEGSLRPSAALALITAVLAGLALIVFLSRFAEPIQHVSLPHPPEVLADKARQTLDKLGYPGPIEGSAHGFVTDYQALRSSQQAGESPANRWPPVLRFWYRQGRHPLVSERLSDFGSPSPFGAVTVADPSPFLPGMTSIQTDGNGRLLSLMAMPDSDAEGAGKDVDWRPTFALAGLDLDRFEKSDDPGPTPPVPTDRRAVWQGVHPETNESIRVRLASRGGRPVYFRVVNAATPADEPEVGLTELHSHRARAGGLLMDAVLLLAAGLFALRNWRLGRGDWVGAARLFWATLALGFLCYLLRATHVAGWEEVGLVFHLFKAVLYRACGVWLGYLALEPMVRRWRPEALITWGRLLAGRPRDPAVGRDLLVGTAGGVAMVLVMQAMAVVPPLGQSQGFGLVYPWGMLGARQGASLLLGCLLSGVGFTVSLLIGLLILRIVLRRFWLAGLGWALLMAVQAGVGRQSIVPALWIGTYFGLLVVVFIRFGTLATVIQWTVASVLTVLPITTDPTAWYATGGYWALGIVAALALYGFFVSLGGRAIFSKDLFGDE